MLKNYLKIAFRNLLKNRIYSLINLFGLALGLTCAVLIIIYINAEFSVDSFLADKENIYRINVISKSPDGNYTTAQTPYPLGPAISNELPGFKDYTRIYLGYHILFSHGNKKYFEDYPVFADSQFFKILSFKLLLGNKNTVLNEPNSVVLTKSAAQKYFGNENPIGEIIRLNNERDLKITGIAENPPVNSSLKFDFIINMKMLNGSIVGFSPDQWGAYTRLYTFVKLSSNINIDKLQETIRNFIDNKTSSDPGYGHELTLQKLTDINLDPSVVSGHSKVTDPAKLYILGSIGVFIILLACINFMNLATARAAKRAKEVGIRKVLGAYRKQLVWQFIGEAVVITFLSLVLSVIFSEVLIGHFSHLVEKEFTRSLFDSPSVIIPMIILTVFIGIAAGTYPAMFLSHFKPITVLKGNLSDKKGKGTGSGFRKALVILQFSISIVFMIGMIIVKEQLNFMQKKNMGFKKDNRIVLMAYEDSVRTGYKAIKAELTAVPGVRDVAIGIKPPVSNNTFGTVAYEKGAEKKSRFPVSLYMTEETYFKDFGMQLVAGRTFPGHYVEGDVKPAVVNETLVKNLNLKSPADAIGERFFTGLNSWQMEIVGVIKDYNHMDLHSKIQALVFFYWPRFFYRYTIEISPVNKQQTIAGIKKVWRKYMSTYPFEYKFLSDEISEMYKTDERTNVIITDFSVIAMLIASLGIFGLVLFTAEQKTKEIGIRKVLGASVKSIIQLISFDFLKLVVIANVIAWPAGYYFMNKWLQEFAYHIDITVAPFLLAGSITLVIALLTISYQSVRAALSNPVESLRYE